MARVPKLTNQLLNTIEEGVTKGMSNFTLGLNARVYSALILEQQQNYLPQATFVNEQNSKGSPYGISTYFATEYGDIEIKVNSAVKNDTVLFFDRFNNEVLGVLQLGGTPNLYRRIILE